VLKKHKSWFKALSFLCVLSLILSIVPPVGIWQNVKADDVTLYNGGYDSYNGKDRNYWMQQAGFKLKEIDKYKSIKVNGKDEYFNCEIYAERRMVVYGEPWDVPQNKYSSPVGFKEDSPQNDNGNDKKYGYFYKQNTTTRGWYRYIGYTQTGTEFYDPEFPPDGNGKNPIVYSNIVETPWADNNCKKLIPSISKYNPSKISDVSCGIIDKSKYLLRNDENGQTLADLFSNLSDMKQKIVVLSVDTSNNAAIAIFHKVNGHLYYRTFSGILPKGDNPSVNTKQVTYSIDSSSYLINNGVNSLKYNPLTNQNPKINIVIIGQLWDNLGTKSYDPYYERLALTRNDVMDYQVKIKSITVNDKVVISDVIGKYISAIKTSSGSDTVDFKNNANIPVYLPKEYFTQETNMVVINATTRVVFNTLNGIKNVDGNDETLSITIVKHTGTSLPTPTLTLSVTPQNELVTLENGKYSKDIIEHQVKPVKVTLSNIPSGYKITQFEFVIDKDINNVTNSTTANIKQDISDGTSNSYTSFTISVKQQIILIEIRLKKAKYFIFVRK